MAAGAHVLLCLSRISPEKGQDFVLEALQRWRGDGRPLWLFICGEAAFMQGAAYARRLRELAGKLRAVRVVLPGYVTGARKRGFLRLADLYLFPSTHESYGLTLVEALGAGLPAIARDHCGAREIIRPEFGVLLSGTRPEAQRQLLVVLEELLHDEARRARMGAAARAWAAAHPFAASAATLAKWLVE
jgi:glycosyltransferase involved in cell wall biosynthesis